MIRLRIEGTGGSIVADICAKALREIGLKVEHQCLDSDSAKEKAAATRSGTNSRAVVTIYEMPSARL